MLHDREFDQFLQHLSLPAKLAENATLADSVWMGPHLRITYQFSMNQFWRYLAPVLEMFMFMLCLTLVMFLVYERNMNFVETKNFRLM